MEEVTLRMYGGWSCGADFGMYSSSSSATSSSNNAGAHQNEGFLKNMWHTLTHQHDHLAADKSAGAKAEEEKKKSEGEPKKASGSA